MEPFRKSLVVSIMTAGALAMPLSAQPGAKPLPPHPAQWKAEGDEAMLEVQKLKLPQPLWEAQIAPAAMWRAISRTRPRWCRDSSRSIRRVLRRVLQDR